MGAPLTSAAYGVSLGAAGVLLAVSLALRERDRLLVRLGTRTAPKRWQRGRWARGRAVSNLVAHAETQGWRHGFGSLAAALAGTGLLGAAVGFRLAGPVGALAGAIGGLLAFQAVLTRRLESRRARAAEQVREVARALAAGTRAGLSVRRALAEAAREAEPPLEAAIVAALRRLDVGAPIGEALAGLARDLASDDARVLMAALEIHRRTGGDLPSLLDEVAAMIGGRVEARRHLRALTAQGRASGVVLAVLPVAFVGLLSGTGGNGLGAFYRTPLGALLLGIGLGLEGLGFLWLRRITRSV